MTFDLFNMDSEVREVRARMTGAQFAAIDLPDFALATAGLPDPAKDTATGCPTSQYSAYTGKVIHLAER